MTYKSHWSDRTNFIVFLIKFWYNDSGPKSHIGRQRVMKFPTILGENCNTCHADCGQKIMAENIVFS